MTGIDTVPTMDIDQKPYHAEHVEAASFHEDKERIPQASKHFSTALANAVEGTTIKKWSKSSFKLYTAIFCCLCCSYANGYDGSLMTAVNAMSHWQTTFGNVGTTGPLIGAVFALYNVGSLIGGPFAAWITDKFGRRIAMAAGAVVIIIGAVICTTAKHIAQFMVGRIILGFGIAILAIAANSYCMEISPPHWRGRCTGIFNCGWYGGAIPAAAITFGTNYIDSDLSWQLPVIFQCAALVIVLILIPFIPESPRYLMAKGREEQAHAFLTTYHGGGDPNAPLVLLEMEEMHQSIATDNMTDKRWWNYSGLFATKGNRWRMLQVSMMAIFGQYSGNGLAYFATVIFEKIGVTSVSAQLGYNLLYSSLAAVGALAGASLTDHMPRRKVLTFGTLLLSITLGVFVGLTSIIQRQIDHQKPVDESVGRGAIAVYVLFGVFCAFTYTPLQAVVISEHLSTPMRAKGLAFVNVLSQCMGFLNLFAGPIALKNIGYRYVLLFVFWDLFEAACWWFLGVEAQGRSLEELDWVYQQPNPVKASKRLD